MIKIVFFIFFIISVLLSKKFTIYFIFFDTKNIILITNLFSNKKLIKKRKSTIYSFV